MTEQHNDVTYVLGIALQDEHPLKGARSLVPIKTRPRIWRCLPLVAATLVLLLIVSSLTVPAVARAVVEFPLLGDSFQKYLTGTGLDLAYQAGLVNELNRSVTTDDVTFTVISAYSDATQALIAFQFSSPDPSRIDQLWEDADGIFPELQSSKSFSGNMQHIPKEGIIYGLLNSKPYSWSLFGRNLTLSVPSLDMEVDFPLQTIPSSLNERVRVNKGFTFDGLKLTIDEVVFSPSAIQVTYSYKNNNQAPPDKHWDLSLRTPDHQEANSGVSGSLKGQFWQGKGVANFLPLDSDEVIIVFTGFWYDKVVKETIPIKPGSSAITSQGTLTVTHVKELAQGSEISLHWSDGILEKADLHLIDATGKTGEVISGEQIDGGLKVVIKHGELTGEVQLAIETLVIREEQDVELARIDRGK